MTSDTSAAALRKRLQVLGVAVRLQEIQTELRALFALAPGAFATPTCPQVVRLEAKAGHTNGAGAHSRSPAFRKAQGARMRKMWKTKRAALVASIAKGREAKKKAAR